MKDRRILTPETVKLATEFVFISAIMAIFAAGGSAIFTAYGLGYIIGLSVAVVTILLVKINVTLESIRDGILEACEDDQEGINEYFTYYSSRIDYSTRSYSWYYVVKYRKSEEIPKREIIRL